MPNLALREKFIDSVSNAKSQHLSRLKSASISDRWKSINAQIKGKQRQSSLDFIDIIDLNNKFQSSFSSPDLHLFSDDRPKTKPSFFEVSES